ncbi:aspartyl-phosphate phosphatase Spo0E family protein [Paenibacillus sp. M1]|uniref:Aspartyl-phosphate phosphatase Spo0E family protein n=1 Tax=Paenibacillus haidiansis TaxID=1574488 RepID=A0ABU7VLK0_9BACL
MNRICIIPLWSGADSAKAGFRKTVASAQRTYYIDIKSQELFALEIIRKIEELRKELNRLAMYKRLADRELVILSQKLDRLLNEFQKDKLGK